jgi:hypothetical protein
MTSTRIALGMLLLACTISTAGAAPAESPVSGRSVGASVAAAPVARRSVRATSATRPHANADSAARPRPRLAPRMLDDIHIEGEIPVPQVLFITARDQRRFMEFQHHRYQKTSLELGRATTTPARIVVTAPVPAERKENQR